MHRKKHNKGVNYTRSLKLYGEYYEDAYTLAFKKLRDHQATHDIVQETIYKVAVTDALGRLIEDKKAYLMISVVNACLTHLKTPDKEQYLSEIEQLATIQHEEPAVEATFNNAHLHHLVKSLTRQLSPINREVIELWLIEQLSDQEIATHLNIPIGTVYTRKSRAKQELLKIIIEKGLNSNDFLVASCIPLLLWITEL